MGWGGWGGGIGLGGVAGVVFFGSVPCPNFVPQSISVPGIRHSSQIPTPRRHMPKGLRHKQGPRALITIPPTIPNATFASKLQLSLCSLHASSFTSYYSSRHGILHAHSVASHAALVIPPLCPFRCISLQLRLFHPPYPFRCFSLQLSLFHPPYPRTVRCFSAETLGDVSR